MSLLLLVASLSLALAPSDGTVPPSDLHKLRLEVEALVIDDTLVHSAVATQARDVLLEILDPALDGECLSAQAAGWRQQVAKSVASQCGPYVNYCIASALLRIANNAQACRCLCLSTADAAHAAQILRETAQQALFDAHRDPKALARDIPAEPPDAELIEINQAVEQATDGMAQGTRIAPSWPLSSDKIATFRRSLADGLAESIIGSASENTPPAGAKKSALQRTFATAYAAMAVGDPCFDCYRKATKEVGPLADAWKSLEDVQRADPQAYVQMRTYLVENSGGSSHEKLANSIRSAGEAARSTERQLQLRNRYLIGIAGAAAGAIRAQELRSARVTANAPATATWHAIELSIEGLDNEMPPLPFYATTWAIARQDEHSFQVRFGLARVEAGNASFLYALQGALLTIPCGPQSAISLGDPGLTKPIPNEEMADCGRQLACNISEHASPQVTSFGLWQAAADSLVPQGVAWSISTGASVHAFLLADHPKAEEEIRFQADVCALCRVEANDSALHELDRLADSVSESRGSVTRLLRADVGRLLRRKSLKPGDPPPSDAPLLEVLAAPPDSPVRSALSAEASGNPSCLLLNEHAAPAVWDWAEARGEGALGEARPGIRAAMCKLLTDCGLQPETAAMLCKDAYAALRARGMVPSRIATAWCLAAYGIVGQARSFSAPSTPEVRQGLLNAVEWMLTDVGRMSSTERQRAWTAWLEQTKHLDAALRRLQSKAPGEDLTGLDAERAQIMASFRGHLAVASFPPLNFRPNETWFLQCLSQAEQESYRDTRNAYVNLQTGEGWPDAMSADTCRFAMHALVSRLYELCLRLPDGSAAPHGYAQVSLPGWAKSFSFMYTPESGPRLTVVHE